MSTAGDAAEVEEEQESRETVETWKTTRPKGSLFVDTAWVIDIR